MKKILVLCPNVWDKEALSRPDLQKGRELIYAFEQLLDAPYSDREFRMEVFEFVRHIGEAWRGQGIAGIVGTGDYPGAILAAHLGKELGLPVPDPKVVTLLSHKYYSREIQRLAAPEATPEYFALDPMDPFASRLPLPYPFFVKPVKGTMSVRARMVKSDAELEQAVHTTPEERALFELMFAPLQQLLDAYSDRSVPALYFIAEAPLSGDQVTVDGFMENGRATIMGIVDSIMYPGTMSFKRFEYPSALPDDVQARMRDIARRVMEASRFDHACFNIEMFYDRGKDRISIIEINPRMSYQFADLYERVDGMNSYEAQVRLALGEPVAWPFGQGRGGAAASFVMRRFEDGLCTRIPTPQEIAEIEARFPGTSVKVLAQVGEKLSAQDQDVESYRYAIINMGAEDAAELHAHYAEVERSLRFEFV